VQVSIEKQDFVPTEDSILDQEKSFLAGKFINIHLPETSPYEYLKCPVFYSLQHSSLI
jgi:hypothetical protein